MAVYIDSGSGQADQDVGHWLDANVVAGIQEFRCQFGYFRYSAIKPFADIIRNLAAAGGQVHFVLGSNSGSLIAADAQRVLRVAAGACASLTIVSFADAEFHPKTVHIVRNDGSITAVVGSSNLTGRGLGQNVEAGVTFDSRAADPANQLERIRAAIDWWRDVPHNANAHPQVAPAVFPITNDDDLKSLVERGIINVPQPRRPRPGGAGGAATGGSQLPRRQPTWRPNRTGWEPGIPDLIPVPLNLDEPEGGGMPPGQTAPTPSAPAAPASPSGTQSTGSPDQEVLLMRVRPRRDGTQLQVSMAVHKDFMKSTGEVISAAGGSPRRVGYDQVTRNGVKVRNTARFEAPELEGIANPVARFEWVASGRSGRKRSKVLRYEIFDADKNRQGKTILKKLEQGIANPATTNLEQLSRKVTVLSKSNQAIAQWYRLDSV